MGSNMVRRLIKAGHNCVAYDVNPEAAKAMAFEGAEPATTMEEFVSKLTKPRVAWLMVPAGAPTDEAIDDLAKYMEAGDIIIDGGNSYFKDDIKHSKTLHPKGIHFVDCGTSGGVWGLERGYCLMIGGSPEAVKHLDPIFKSLAPGLGTIERTPGREKVGGTAELGYLHCGPTGSGHFVKMIHNGVEYGLMQAYAEGLDILKNANSDKLSPERRYDLNIADITEVWRRGSVVGSWLLDLVAMALVEDAKLDNFSGYVYDSGEGRWTVEAAIDEAVPAEVISAALFTRFRSRESHTFSEKVLSAMRYKFGGHRELRTGD
jgi:6-phosphogluconate dehydrogenase